MQHFMYSNNTNPSHKGVPGGVLSFISSLSLCDFLIRLWFEFCNKVLKLPYYQMRMYKSRTG